MADTVAEPGRNLLVDSTDKTTMAADKVIFAPVFYDPKQFMPKITNRPKKTKLKKSKLQPSLKKFSPITYGILRFFVYLKYISVMKWLSYIIASFQSRSELSAANINNYKFITKRAFAIETYIIGWLIFEFLFTAIFCSVNVCIGIKIFGAVMVSLRIIEILQVSINTTIFDSLNGRPENLVASTARMIILAGINFIELLLCFGIIYASDYTNLSGAGQAITAFYFSGITQLTIGYGDVFPKGWLRVIALVQGLSGTLFIVLIFGRFISALKSIKEAFK